MPIPVLAVKSFDNSTSALAGSHAAQHSVMVLPCACAGVVPTPTLSADARTPYVTRSAFAVCFITLSLLVEPAIDRARLSYPLECFEQSDTVLDGLNELTDVSSRMPEFLGIQASSICLVNHDLLNIATSSSRRDNLERLVADAPAHAPLARIPQPRRLIASRSQLRRNIQN